MTVALVSPRKNIQSLVRSPAHHAHQRRRRRRHNTHPPPRTPHTPSFIPIRFAPVSSPVVFFFQIFISSSSARIHKHTHLLLPEIQHRRRLTLTLIIQHHINPFPARQRHARVGVPKVDPDHAHDGAPIARRCDARRARVVSVVDERALGCSSATSRRVTRARGVCVCVYDVYDVRPYGVSAYAIMTTTTRHPVVVAIFSLLNLSRRPSPRRPSSSSSTSSSSCVCVLCTVYA